MALWPESNMLNMHLPSYLATCMINNQLERARGAFRNSKLKMGMAFEEHVAKQNKGRTLAIEHQIDDNVQEF